MEDNNIVKKLVFRFIRRHIAGTTTDSAIKAALQLNESGIKATLTFLSEGAKETNKARYNVNAYSHLLKQISRLRVNADVSLRPGQIGYGINGGGFERGISEVMDAAKNGRVFVWVECGDEKEALSLNKMLKRQRYGNAGIEIPIQVAESVRFMKEYRATGMPIKLNLHEKRGGKGEGKAGARQLPFSRPINAVLEGKCNLGAVSIDEREITALVRRNRGYKRNLTFEVLLGYGNKRVKEIMKDGIGISVYVPYGKDWVPYAINRLAAGRMREIATTLLDGEEKGSTDGKKRQQKRQQTQR